MKEKEKLKNLENVHFQKRFAKQTFQVFLSKLRSPLTCVCLIIYTFFQRFGEGDLRCSGYLIYGFCVGHFCSLDTKLWEEQIQSAQEPVWVLHSDYCHLASFTDWFTGQCGGIDFSGEGWPVWGAKNPAFSPAVKN